MHSEVFTPHPLMPSKFEKRDLREKPRNLLQSDEQCQEHLSVICAKIPSATSGSNKGMKIVPKAFSGAIARHSGDGKFYAMPHNEALGQGLTSGTSFEPVRESDPRKFRPGRLLWPNGA